jgi:hypothetical protein
MLPSRRPFGLGLWGRFGLRPIDGGRLELPCVFGGDSRSFGRLLSSAMRAKASRNCAACAKMRASFSAAESLAGPVSSGSHRLQNRVVRDRVSRFFAGR